ncbi:regulator [Streptomyces parvus]|uniref:regulator n=1 Tax=Streptomyces parvus TaxID=66428 RepID=UPI0035DB48F4
MATELPVEIAYFVDREDEGAQIFDGLEQWAARERPFCVVLWGAAGLGRTELALKVARTLNARTEAPVLMADLDRIRLRGVADPGDALGHMLTSLGAEALEPDFDARCRQYRRLTAGRRLIVLLDNVHYASEVAPLLPPSGDALVIVVSRGPLPDLADGTALEIPLPPLPEPVALELLGLLARDRRLTADPEAARELAQLCSGLPAALWTAGAWLRRNPLVPLPRLLAELAVQFREKGITGVETMWDETYAELAPSAALLYRLMAGTPEISWTRDSAAALLGRGEEACDDALQELNRAGFLDIRDLVQTEDGRVGLPEWLGDHARRRARLDASEGELEAAQYRFVRWVLRQGQRADRFAAGGRLTVADEVLPIEGAPDTFLPDPGEAAGEETAAEHKVRAARWFYQERHTLFACVRLACARGWDDEAWMLSEPVWTFFLDHPHQSDVTDVFRSANEAAVRTGNAAAIVRTCSQLARALWQSDRTDEADEVLRRAAAAARLLGASDRDAKLRASVAEFRGTLNGVRGDWATAAGDFEESRELHRAIPNPYGEMLLTYRLGQARAALGEPEAAVSLLTRAHEMAREQERARMTGRTALALGEALRTAGRTADARELLQSALDISRARGSDVAAAGVLDALALLADDEGRPEEAAEHRSEAESLRRSHGLA